MGWLSSAWKSTKKAVSSAWDSTKDAITDVTGVESLNTLLLTGGLANATATLSGKGIFGEAFADALSPLTTPPGGPPPGPAAQGPLNQPLPSNMGLGGINASAPAPQAGASNIASLFGESGYSSGPTTTSSALLQSNPEAYQYAPLARQFA